MKTQLNLIRLVLIPALFFAGAAGAQVSGNVFRDINNDGVRQSINPAEPGEFGVVVKAYDASNTLRASATTNSNGDYSFSAAQLPSGLAIRIEFIGASGDFPSKRMAANRSNVQFTVAGSAAVNIDHAITSKKLLNNNSNPYVATTAFVNGDANVSSGSNGPGKYNSLYVFPYDLSSDGGNARRAKNSYTGSVFGLAWQKESRILLMSAYLKRHSGFGPNGIGAIYQTQISTSGNPSNPSLLVDVTSIGINVGTDPRTTALPADASTPNTDAGVFAEVGKRGIGSIELSDDGRDLYIVNMYEKKLHRINIGNPIKSSFTAADVTGNWVIPAPAIAGTVWHPMAIKLHNNKFYIGGVAVKETTGQHNTADTVNMKAVVYEFNPATNTFTEVLRFPLTHRKGYSNNDYKYEFRNNYWSAWQNNGDISYGGPLRNGLIYNPGYTPTQWATALYYGQPLLSAIEFDVDGSMILAIRDRFGDQGGYANYFETGNVAGETYRTLSSGEVLRAGKNGSGWTLENNGSVTTNGVTTTTPGVTNNNMPQTGNWVSGDTGSPWGGTYGPGGGYYYYNFNYSLLGVPAPFNTVAENRSHYLKSNGGLAVLPGYNEVMTTAIDPMNVAYSNGLIKNVNTGANAGNMNARMNLIISASGDPATMGKAAALGDLELLLDAAKMEIGNRVWEDANGNGIQDATEPGIANVTVKLKSPGLDGIYGNSDDQTWTVVTDAAGHYYFDETIVNDNRRPASWLGVSATNSGILPGFEYLVEIDGSQSSLAGLFPTRKNAAGNLAIDSDGSPAAGNTIKYIVNPGGSTAPASVFKNDYNVDFGFYSMVLPLKQVNLFAALNNNDVQVKWNTIEEFDVSRYHVERSINGTSFTEINMVTSKGNGNFSYAVNDNIGNLDAVTVYYRLRIEDISGREHYSEVVKVNPAGEIQFQAAPNPFTNGINLQINNDKRTEATVHIVNMSGQMVYNKKFVLVKGLNSVGIQDLQNLSRGIYVIEVAAGEKHYKNKLLKQ